ncbi:TonB-dependent receptor [Bdellovibrio sp. 22V]|uniref:TonB-dependent receptor domain-containing protein n=1 Tax=Bdellovibrio sp. 22V TaxID=3044166 RepID=UPI00254272D0|nr:TonB-dependent receptor [Bdellovibrio sp. 22V]WII71673.1 TonB-dependent receptor [Bdellovibrio sp. 22V]
MKFNSRFKLSVFVFLFSPLMVHAQENANESEIETIQIKDDAKTPSKTIISSERLEQTQAEDVKESLKGVADVIVGGGQKAGQKVYVRGVEDTQLNVTIDGARQSGYLFHHQGRLSIDTELVKEIDIEAGTGNALAGPGALGGSLRFQTKDPEDLLLPGQRHGAFAKLRYTTNADEKGASLGVFGKATDSAGYLLYGNFADSGNYHAGGGDAVNYTAGTPKSGLAKLTIAVSEVQKLTVTANLREDNAKRSLRAHFGDLPFNPPNDQKFGSETYTLQHVYAPISSWVNLRSELYVTKTTLSQESATGKSQAYAQSFGGQIANKTEFNSLHSMVIGTDYNVDRSEGERATGTEAETGKIFGLFAQDQIQLAEDWKISAGLRFDSYDLEDVAGQIINAHHFSPNIKLSYQWNLVWSSYVSWSQAFKGPTPMEAFVMSNVKTVTPVVHLKGTTAETSEVGVQAKWASVHLDTVFYSTVMRDAIDVSTNRITGVMTRSNAKEDLKFQGVNINAIYSQDVFSLRGGYAHNKSEYGDEPLGYIAFNQGSSFGDRFVLGIDYKVVPYNVLLSWDSLVTLKLTDVPSGSREQPGYDTHDIAASWIPNEHWRWGLSILNIFDKKYIAQGTPYQVQGGENTVYEPGRDFRFTMSYLF